MSQIDSQSVHDFLESLAAKTPTPGGGAAASVAGALAGALGEMVVNFSVGKKSLEAHRPQLEHALETLARARDILIELAEEDAAAYATLNDLMKLPDGHDRKRLEWKDAVTMAVQVPRSVAAACCDLLRLLETLAPITNTNLRSDLAIAAILADAAARSAWWNIAVNLPLLNDPGEREAIHTSTKQMLADAAARRERIEQACV